MGANLLLFVLPGRLRAPARPGGRAAVFRFHPGASDQPLDGYSDFSSPTNIDPKDVVRLTEAAVWLKYALAARLQARYRRQRWKSPALVC